MRSLSKMLVGGLSLVVLAGCPAEPTLPQAPDTHDKEDAATDASSRQGPNPGEQTQVLDVPLTESWVLPGLDKEVHVVRTATGVPHLYAHNATDLARALGFTIARERYFAMDLQRRLALGTIGELLGDRCQVFIGELPRDRCKVFIGGLLEHSRWFEWLPRSRVLPSL